MTGSNFTFSNDGLEFFKYEDGKKIVDAYVSHEICFGKFFPMMKFSESKKISLDGKYLEFEGCGKIAIEQIEKKFVAGEKVFIINNNSISHRKLYNISFSKIVENFMSRYSAINYEICSNFAKKLIVDGDTILYNGETGKFRLYESDFTVKFSTAGRSFIWCSVNGDTLTGIVTDGNQPRMIHEKCDPETKIDIETIMACRKKFRVFVDSKKSKPQKIHMECGNIVNLTSEYITNAVLIYSEGELIIFGNNKTYIITSMLGDKSDVEEYIKTNFRTNYIIGWENADEKTRY